MEQNSLAVIVLAAGLGKRFRSDLPKVLQKANGVELVSHVLRTVAALGADRVIVVVGHKKELVIERVADRGIEFAEQDDQLGTGDAVARCKEQLRGFRGTVVVLNGDSPLLRSSTVLRLIEEHRESQAHISLLIAKLDDPSGYGRILRGADGTLEGIVEEADASPDQLSIDEVSTGVFCFDSSVLFDALEGIAADNAQGEYYLPDAALAIRREGGMMYTTMADDPSEITGVNDRSQLAEASRLLRMRYLDALAAGGVTIEDPFNTYIDDGVEVGADTVIKPFTFLEGSTKIGSGSTIGPNTRILDSAIGDKVTVTFAVVLGAEIGEGASVGPFAYLRPGTKLGANSRIGTFVEVKGSEIGEGSKANHLSYLGDAEIGRDVNIGAGTITANYDRESKEKGKTIIGDDAFTGSDTTLIAPVRMGKGAGTGAGAVVTKDVDDDEVVAGVPARPFRRRKRKKE